MAHDSKQIGATIRSLRRSSGLTQEQLAAQAEMSVAHLSRIEGGKKSAGLETVVQLAAALDVAVDDLLGLAPGGQVFDAEWKRLTADCLPDERQQLLEAAEAMKKIFLKKS